MLAYGRMTSYAINIHKGLNPSPINLEVHCLLSSGINCIGTVRFISTVAKYIDSKRTQCRNIERYSQFSKPVEFGPEVNN